MRFYSLQILRGLSALIVVLFHIFQFSGFRPFGYMFAAQSAVDVFFLLSGFIILYTLKNIERASSFAIRRIFRIFPLYIVILCLHLFIIDFQKIQDVNWTKVVLNLFMIPYGDNIYRSFILVVAWSTAFECYFYTVIFLLMLFKFEKMKISILLIFSLIGLFVTSKYFLLASNPNSLILRQLDMIIGSYHIFMFIIGSVIFYFFDYLKRPVSQIITKTSFGFSTLIFILFLLTPYNPIVAILLVPMVFVSWLKMELDGLFQFENLIARTFIYLGEISFSIFLCHMIFVKILISISKEYIYFYTFLVFTFTITFSIISFKYIELNFIKKGRVLIEKQS